MKIIVLIIIITCIFLLSLILIIIVFVVFIVNNNIASHLAGNTFFCLIYRLDSISNEWNTGYLEVRLCVQNGEVIINLSKLSLIGTWKMQAT